MKRLLKNFRVLFVLPVFAVLVVSQPFESRKPLNLMDFDKAAKSNTVLMNNLQWKWGKQQTGWRLYVPLIQKTLETSEPPGSAGFAEEVSVWQSDNGLTATGVLDGDTLYAIISYWQSNRLKPIYEASMDDLLTADIKEFYDPTRDSELLKVDKLAFAAYKKMVSEADRSLSVKFGESGRYLSIISSYRSPEYQAELRRKEPGANRAQLAFRSPHFTGRALDIYVGGEPVTTKDANRAIQIKTPAYLWLVENAEKFGFYPYFYEPWHWEYVGERKTEN